MAHVIITGGTGLIGKRLATLLASAGYQVTILTRRVQAARSWHSAIRFAGWDVAAGTLDTDVLATADAIVHLAGAGVVDKSWTPAYKQEIVDSRVQSAGLIARALANYPNQVKVVVSASAIGWYGADAEGAVPFEETAPADTAFLGETCRLWEEAMAPVAQLGKRLVYTRIGIVLANEGGALPQFKKPLRFRVAGIIGSGSQVVSWIHIDDLCGIIQFAIENEALTGAYNAVAPSPVSNRELNLALGRAMYGKWFLALPVPRFVLKLMLGERSIEVLKSTTVSAKKIIAAGYHFRNSTIGEAMQQLVRG
jgi:uncharacterized protein (TIGR01777 family)